MRPSVDAAIRAILTFPTADLFENIRKVAIRVARPPSGANCTVSPSRGKALLTDFRLQCWGWVAGDALAGPLSYTFQAVKADGARIALGTHNSSAAMVRHPSTMPVSTIWRRSTRYCG